MYSPKSLSLSLSLSLFHSAIGIPKRDRREIARRGQKNERGVPGAASRRLGGSSYRAPESWRALFRSAEPALSRARHESERERERLRGGCAVERPFSRVTTLLCRAPWKSKHAHVRENRCALESCSMCVCVREERHFVIIHARVNIGL